MTHILTIGGYEQSLLPPLGVSTERVSQPTITEIAWSLAHINRFTGHAQRSYSVAEHSLLVADIAGALGADVVGQLCALMHDAHECIDGDVSSPVKGVLGTLWGNFEDYHQSALLQHYGLLMHSNDYAEVIKRADLIALATERRDLMYYNPTTNAPWPSIDTAGSEHNPWDEVYLMSEFRCKCKPEFWSTQFETIANAMLAEVRPLERSNA